MNLYTIVFIIVAILLLIGLGLFGLFISKLDKWIDRKERLGKESVFKEKKENENKSTRNDHSKK